MIPLRDSVHAWSFPAVNYALIGLNVGLFLYELGLGPDLGPFLATWGLVPARYFLVAEVDPGNWVALYLPFLTSMFLHGGWGHLLGNMVYLWVFGENVEDRLGHGRYLVFYLLTGVAAGLTHVHLIPASTVPTVGASGAISGVLGAYLVLFPRARVLTLVPLVFLFFQIVELPAVLYLGLWFLVQLLGGGVALLAGPDVGGVAWWAHVGGFVAGAALGPLVRRRPTSRRAWVDPYYPW